MAAGGLSRRAGAHHQPACGLRDRRDPGRALPRAARRARAGAICLLRRRLAPRRRHRLRLGHPARGSEALRLHGAGPRVQPRSRHADDRAVPADAQAPRGRPLRAPGQPRRARPRPGAGPVAFAPRGRRAPLEAEQQAGARHRGPVRGHGMRARVDRGRDPGGRLRLARRLAALFHRTKKPAKAGFFYTRTRAYFLVVSVVVVVVVLFDASLLPVVVLEDGVLDMLDEPLGVVVVLVPPGVVVVLALPEGVVVVVVE